MRFVFLFILLEVKGSERNSAGLKRTKYVGLSKNIGVVETVIIADKHMRPLVKAAMLLGNMPGISPLWVLVGNRFSVKRITRLNLNASTWQNSAFARAKGIAIDLNVVEDGIRCS